MIAFLLLFLSLGRLYREMFRQPESRALLLLATLVLVIGVVFYMRVEHWGLLDAIYFCVVTLGTVGYGDITPKTDFGRLFTVFYVIIGLSVIGGFLATMGRLINPGQLREREHSSLARSRALLAGEPQQDSVQQADDDTPAH